MWLLIGLSIFSLMRMHSSFHLRLLLAPALGLAINIVALFTLSRIGLPIKAVAMPLFVSGVLLAGYFLFTQRIIWKHKSFISFCILILLALVPFAWPLLRFGFEWLAFVNGDMGYYSISSTRLLDYAYSEMPSSGNIRDIKNHSLLMWEYHNNWSYRTGADLLLANLVGLTGMSAHQVYMPLILAINFCVAASAGALTLLGSKKWSLALWTMCLVAISPMLTVEVTMQLLAQAIGLALLTSTCISYTKAMTGTQIWPWRIYTIVSLSSLLISYFEVIPFFVLYVILFEVTQWKKWTQNSAFIAAYLRSFLVITCGMLVVLNSYLFSTIERIVVATKLSFGSVAMTLQADGASIFPYFFVPSNGALLWGWVPLSGQPNSLVTLLGLLASGLFAAGFISSKIRALPSAQMSAVMLTAAIVLWIGDNAYGLFKIAMFIQPFFLSTIVIMLTLFITKRLLQQVSLCFLGLSFIPAQYTNIKKVSGGIGSSPVPYASTAKIGEQLREIRSELSALKNIKLFSGDPSHELFSLQSYYFKGIAFDNLTKPLPLLNSVGHPKKFVFLEASNNVAVDFVSKDLEGSANEYLLTATGEFSVINRMIAGRGFLYRAKPISQLSNYLVQKQISSPSFSSFAASLYQLEADPMFSSSTMSAIGQRYHLFEVLGPIDESRMLVSVTSSYIKPKDYLLPMTKIVGATDVELPLIGRGSARVISAPINPRQIDSSAYIGLDFGRQGIFIDHERHGAMALFGNHIKMDSRKVVVFSKDISFLSPDQYAKINRPRIVQGFPSSLENTGLEYSGIFEDGWISNAAYVVLQTPMHDAKSSLRVSGMIPRINEEPFSTQITIKVNDKIVYKTMHTSGEINITVPLKTIHFEKNNIAKIQIESDQLQYLPNGDGRPVSMLLRIIEIK